MARKKERKCPCGSRKLFSECCKYPRKGETPENVKKVITKIVISTFDSIGETRGETCLYVSTLVKELLKEFEINSYVVAGSSRWNNVLTFYDWKPPVEFHAWIVTEYGEIVDLACDALNERRDILDKSWRNAPSKCWSKELIDRTYIGKELGAKSFPFDHKGFDIIKDEAFRLLKNNI
ncbi:MULTISPECIES: hypothetical protein [Bacillus cereus group]|uniref:hypothetical protein n=1 Tax=Bacillus cereus group TaxID=86661 RepID=UPI000BFA20CD|nr:MULTISPECIES: hypothetical protein [Bacillus cereus group]PEV47429.1 hypothetical protein CN426_07895 [Bacillus thuringiensis]PGS52907.1 hypothetical protein COC66_22030 [Bacillus cereus]